MLVVRHAASQGGRHGGLTLASLQDEGLIRKAALATVEFALRGEAGSLET